MTPLERQKLESLKEKISDVNLSEEARRRSAREAMDYADQFPGEKKKMLEEAYDKKQVQEGIGSESLLEFIKLPTDGIVSENTNLVWFTFEELYRNGENRRTAGEQIVRFQNPRNYANFTEESNDLFPQGFKDVVKENIDYSEYSDLPTFKNRITVKKYKDGLLLVSNERGKAEGYTMCLNFVDSTPLEYSRTENKCVFMLHQSQYTNLGEIDWHDPIFDKGKQLNLYLVFPKIKKNMAIKFSIKNNKHIMRYVDFFRNGEPVKEWPGEFKYYRQNMGPQYALLQKWRDASNIDPLKNKYATQAVEELGSISNSEFAQLGYKISIGGMVLNLLKSMSNDEFVTELNKAKKMSLNEIIKTYANNLQFVNLVSRLYFTNNGKTFVDGRPINFKDKTKLDCYYFWQHLSYHDICTNVLNENNFPLAIKDGVKLNDLELTDPIHVEEETLSHNYDGDPKEAEQFRFKNQHILDEAMDSQTGYMMPYDGVWPIKGDPYFKFIKFREFEDKITILVCDENERFVSDVFDKKTRLFSCGILLKLTSADPELTQEIYTKIAGVIRDAKVLVERDSTMGYRGRIKPYGCKTESLYDVYYYPRVRYVRNPDKDYSKREKEYQKESRVFSGSRRAHIRKLPEGSKPSKLQILLAKKAEMLLPPNHTYVKSSVWGENGMTQKEKRYRSKSIDGLFYYNKEEMDKATEIGYLSPAGFEEYCEKYLSRDKWKITERSNHDGGIDIRALKEFKDGSIKSLLVQCKHWKTPIPPGEMRDFITACNLEKTEHEKVKMFITSSKFSPKARSLAEEHNIELIDGDILLG